MKPYIPRIIFDVGANNGDSCIPDLNIGTIIYAFEPTPEMIEVIKSKTFGKPNYILTEKAVSDFNGKATFHVAGQADWGCSSLLKFSDKSKTDWPGRTDFRVSHDIEVEVIRLDKFIEENKIDHIDFLHVDTQGSDLKVLQGLGDYISIVHAGEIEAGAKDAILYEGQNTQLESVEFLISKGFHIMGIDNNDPYGNEVNISFNRSALR